MTEIKIEKKKPIWPWILLILGIAALVYFLVFREEEVMDDPDDEMEIQDTSALDQNTNSTDASATYYL